MGIGEEKVKKARQESTHGRHIPWPAKNNTQCFPVWGQWVLQQSRASSVDLHQPLH